MIDRLGQACRAQGALVQKIWISDLYKGPRVRIYEMTLEGPLHDQWPPASHRGIVGNETDASKLNVEQVLLNSPVRLSDGCEVSGDRAVHRFLQSQTASGMAANEALKQVLTAILTSPRFLLMKARKGRKQLDDFQLATRPYALWCSTPDERLLKLAAEGI